MTLVYVAMVEQHYADHVTIHGAWADRATALASLHADRHALFLGSDIVLYECDGTDSQPIESWWELELADTSSQSVRPLG